MQQSKGNVWKVQTRGREWTYEHNWEKKTNGTGLEGVEGEKYIVTLLCDRLYLNGFSTNAKEQLRGITEGSLSEYVFTLE